MLWFERCFVLVFFFFAGNICRSPAAEGVFRSMVGDKGLDSRFSIDSAGTIDYHEVVILSIFFFFDKICSSFVI